MDVSRRRTAFVATFLLVAACGTDEETPDSTGQEVLAESPAMDTAMMPGMGGMPMGAMMEQMQGHMQMMAGASADSIRAMMRQHGPMEMAMLEQMNLERERMGLGADSAWTATMDSLRQDMSRMPQMTDEELERYVSEHHARMNRLMEMHRGMGTMPR